MTNPCREGAAKGYFITSGAPGLFLKPGFFRWWNAAPVCALDLTNPAAVAWFVHRLRALQAATGVDGFKFDAGARSRPAALHVLDDATWAHIREHSPS